MLRTGRISGALDFIGNIVFSIAIIFLCCFGMVGVFNFLSKQDVSDMSGLANNSADSIVSTVTGISIDEDSIGSKLSKGIQDIVYGFENKKDYDFSDALADAKNLFSNVFDDTNVSSTIENITNSTTNLIDDSANKEE